MKSFYLFVLIASLSIYSCKTAAKKENPTTSKIDTIQTQSGLKYFYIKHGNGPKVETGDEVKTYLSLTVNDKVIWNTDGQQDSLLTFFANKDRMIKGFTEMILLLREGDEVVAIMPDSIAYGSRGAGDLIPPNTTLVYDQFKVAKVTKPAVETE